VQLNEHLSKALVESFGVPCNEGQLVFSAEDAVSVAETMGYPVAVKAQLPVSGRQKAGGVLKAGNGTEVQKAFADVVGIRLGGMSPVSARVEHWSSPDSEVFLAVALSAAHRAPVVLFSPSGGVDVESGEPPKVVDIRADGSLDVAAFHRAVSGSRLPPPAGRRLLSVAQALLRAYAASDARLIELNPIGIFGERVEVLDARIIVDDNALFRQERVAAMVRASAPRPPEDIERELSGLEYVPLSGTIGLVSGGAGMTLAVMDLIKEFGEEPACFLDCSANPTRRGYSRALEILAGTPEVEATIISIFGGLTLVDKVARNLCDLLAEGAYEKPVTIRLMGTNIEEADAVLAAAGHHNHQTLEAAVEAVIEQARSQRQLAAAAGGVRP
jgi:succinyl-CoA synthetase beta subunit